MVNNLSPYLVICIFILIASPQLFNSKPAFIAEASRDIARREALGVVRRNQGPVNGPHSPHDHSGGDPDTPSTHY